MTAYLDLTPEIPDGALRLFCFPYAGGGSTLYRRWQGPLGPGVAVCPVHLPGRERRARHPRFVDMAALVADLDAELGPHLGGPHLFFGHSMGAMIAYRLARRRCAGGAAPPRALLLSSVAPGGATRLPRPSDTSTSALARMLVDLGGLPEDVLAHPDWLEIMLPVVRDDLRLCASAGSGNGNGDGDGDGDGDGNGDGDSGAPPLPVPFHLFGGRDDPIVAPADLGAWHRHSALDPETTLFEGGHFYLRDAPGPFLAALRETISRYQEPTRPAHPYQVAVGERIAVPAGWPGRGASATPRSSARSDPSSSK